MDGSEQTPKTDILCINCGIRVNRIWQCLALDLDIRVISLLTEWIAPGIVLKSIDVPYFSKPRILLHLHKIIQKLQHCLFLREHCYGRPILHPKCNPQLLTLGELWDLPLESDRLYRDCSKPLYTFTVEPPTPDA